jgi:hypothetical protein
MLRLQNVCIPLHVVCRASTDPDFGHLHAARVPLRARVGAFHRALQPPWHRPAALVTTISLSGARVRFGFCAGWRRETARCGRAQVRGYRHATAFDAPSTGPSHPGSALIWAPRICAIGLTREPPRPRHTCQISRLNRTNVRCGAVNPCEIRGIFRATHSSSLEPPLRHNNFTILSRTPALDSDSRGMH